MQDSTETSAQFQRKIEKAAIPSCSILGVDIAAIHMPWLLAFTQENLRALSGDYICVVNAFSNVTGYQDPSFAAVLNGAALAIPDGGPLSTVGRKRGYPAMERTTGPDFMGEIFKRSAAHGWRHYFYGSTEATLARLRQKLLAAYPGLDIVGMHSPPFRPLTPEEDRRIVAHICGLRPDFLWVGLGCPKQERWMQAHQGQVPGLMVGVGAGFDYFAGTLSRAPAWMQAHNLEWVYRLCQEPKRLFWKYWRTNLPFIWHAMIRGK